MRISIHFSLVPGHTSDLPIRMRVSYDGLRLDLRTGYVCSTEQWDCASMRVRPRSVNRYGETAQIINLALSKMETAITDILTRYDLDGSIPDTATLKADFNRTMGRKPRKGDANNPDNKTFLDIYRSFISQHGRSIASSTTIGYTSIIPHLEKMPFASRPIDQLTIKDLSDLLNEFYQQGVENQTICTYLSKIKSFLRNARREGIYHGTLQDDFRPKLKGLNKKDIHYLEWDEFIAILNTDLTRDIYRDVRDAFCFSCCTGLRVSDCSALRWRDVHRDVTPDHIQVVTKKTSQPIKIELNQYSRLILSRQEQGEPDDLVFTKISINTRNEYISRIAHMAGITGKVRYISFSGNTSTETYVDKADAITSHWGRHTFVVHALHLGISTEVIASWTGHTNTAGLRPYLAISEQTKQQNMHLFDDADPNK